MSPTLSLSPDNHHEPWEEAGHADIRVFCYSSDVDVGGDLAVALLSLTEQSACLAVRAPLQRLHRVVLVLERPRNPQLIGVSGRVAWSVTGTDGTWCVFIDFLQVLREVDCQVLGLL